ncbi:MAG: helix-hairpin-helix domain-containing protein [Oscillospiraceae bacterium]|jgi:hypothetical protein|nr:helix-hairpin-helix domain-containing protein [Oscillospiraceae bacterium]
MNITNRGKKWELLNSLWILWSFTLLLACVGFFWIGGRAGKRKWILSGLIYLVTNFGLILVSERLEAINGLFSDMATVIICCGWFAAIVHSFMSRKEYLLRREAVIDLKEATRDAYRDEIRGDYFGNNEKPVPASSLPADKAAALSASQTAPAITPEQKIDLNLCSEQELANLPGVGVALAKKAVEMRTQTGGFASVQDFCERINLMPHFAVQIEALAFAVPVQTPVSSQEDTGRVVDI